MSTADATDVSVDWLAQQLTDRRARGIASTIAQQVQLGTLTQGMRLPTIRDLAPVLGVSIGTVAEAWQALRNQGLIVTHRRGGTLIANHSAAPAPAPTAFQGWARMDLSQGTPDPALLPDLGPALLAGLQAPRLHAPQRERITPRLLAAVAPSWPFLPEAWSTAGGGIEGELLALASLATAPARIAVESPTSPRILEALERLGLQALPVACDAEGPLPEALAEALHQQPAAFVFQPRAQVPLGFTLRRARAQALAAVLETAPEVMVLEDDAAGPVSQETPASLGRWLPGRVLHLRSYCKSYGIDLRTCVVGGPRVLVTRFDQQRSLGTGVTSRILQDALAFLIDDPVAAQQVDHARARYQQRRDGLCQALQARGLPITQDDGFVLWLPVQDEVAALLALAAHGVSAGPGRRCFVERQAQGHLRVAITHLPDDDARLEELAGYLHDAASGRGSDEFD